MSSFIKTTVRYLKNELTTAEMVDHAIRFSLFVQLLAIVPFFVFLNGAAFGSLWIGMAIALFGVGTWLHWEAVKRK